MMIKQTKLGICVDVSIFASHNQPGPFPVQTAPKMEFAFISPGEMVYFLWHAVLHFSSLLTGIRFPQRPTDHCSTEPSFCGHSSHLISFSRARQQHAFCINGNILHI